MMGFLCATKVNIYCMKWKLWLLDFDKGFPYNKQRKDEFSRDCEERMKNFCHSKRGKSMISKNLLNLRKKHKMTQEDVAEKLGVSRQAVAKWENGDTTPDIGNCVALAKLYKVSVDELVNDTADLHKRSLENQKKHLFGVVSMGDKGQIVIPKKAREVFHLEAGDKLVVLGDEDQGIALVKANEILDNLRNFQREIERS